MRWHAAMIVSLLMAMVVGAFSPMSHVPAEAAAAPSIDAGMLVARLDPETGRLVVRDGRGDVLVESGSARLGIRTPLGTHEVTRLLDTTSTQGRLVATLETNDPAGRALTLVLVGGPRGSLRVAVTPSDPTGVTAVSLGFAARRGERYFGTGERADAVARNGTQTLNYVADGPYTEEDRNYVRATIPPWGFGDRDDSTYFPIPWVLSSRGYGVLARQDETSTFDFTDPEQWTVEVEAAQLTLDIFPGPTPADALRRFSAAVGRQPAISGGWWHGPWFQTGQANWVEPAVEHGYVRTLQEADAPVSVAETHMRYLPCGDKRGNEEREQDRTAWFHRRGLAILTYVNPLLCVEYAEVFGPAAEDGALQETETGQPFVFPGYVGGAVPTVRPLSQFDFSEPSADEHFGAILDEMVAHGHDGWMEDFGEYTPLQAHDERGRTGTALHNAYVRDYHCAAQRLSSDSRRPLVRFVRSGWTGSAKCSPIVWGGDPTSHWGYDGLEGAVKTGLSSGLSGIGVWGSDIGGFFALNQTALTPELLDRWIQFGLVSGVMRTKGEGVEIPDKDRPAIWEEPHLSMWRRYAKLRTQLAPYVAEAAAVYRRTGLPMMRHLVLTHPYSAAAQQDDVFTLGRDLLAAPVLNPGQRTRTLILPPGRWVDLWRSATFRTGPGALALRGAQVLRGERRVTVPAPRNQLPLFVRAGAVLPMLDPSVDTLTRFGSAPDVVSARERADRMRLLAFPHGRSVTRFGQERVISAETATGWRLRIQGTRSRRYRIQASLRTLRRPYEVCSVTLDQRRLPDRAWDWAPRNDVLTLRIRADDATVRAVRC